MARKVIIGGGTGKKGFAGFPVSAFSGLQDTPHSYTGKTKNILQVNTAETALEFIPGRSQVNGVAALDSAGKVPAAQLPAIAITDYLGIVANQAAMLLLVGEKGDWCIRSDRNTVFVIVGDDPTIIANWQELAYPLATGKVFVDSPDPVANYLSVKINGIDGIAAAVIVSPYPPYEEFLNIGLILDNTALEIAGTQLRIKPKWLHYLPPVLDIFDNTLALPVGPALGDRYIAKTTAFGWTANHIYEYNGATWDNTTPVTGDIVSDTQNDGEPKAFIFYKNYNGTHWSEIINEFDPRLIDARTPTAHAASHNAGGADAMAIDAAAATGSLRTLGTGSTAAAAGNHTHTRTITKEKTLYNASGITAAVNIEVCYFNRSATVTNVRAKRIGGTGATINARRNGADNHLSSALSLTTTNWTDGGAVQNTAYVSGDYLQVMIVTAAGGPTQIAIEVDFTETD